MKKIKRLTRTFNIDFISLCEAKTDQEKYEITPFNLRFCLKSLKEAKNKNNIIDKTINGEKIRLQEIYNMPKSELLSFSNLMNETSIWILIFLKFKDSELIGLADDNGNFDEDAFDGLGKHIASPTVCLYHETQNILAIARNKEGVTSSEILEFFRRIFKKTDLDCTPIVKGKNLQLSDIELFKNLDISFGELNTISQSTKAKITEVAPSVSSAILATETFGFNSMTLKGSMGDDREAGFKECAGSELLALSMLELKNLRHLKLGVKIKGQKHIETIDLINDRLTDQFSITYNQGQRIKISSVLYKLLESYNKNILKI